MEFRTAVAIAAIAAALSGCATSLPMTPDAGSAGAPYAEFSSSKTSNRMLACLAKALPPAFHGQAFVAKDIGAGEEFAVVPRSDGGEWRDAYSVRVKTADGGTTAGLYVVQGQGSPSTTTAVRDAIESCR